MTSLSPFDPQAWCARMLAAAAAMLLVSCGGGEGALTTSASTPAPLQLAIQSTVFSYLKAPLERRAAAKPDGGRYLIRLQPEAFAALREGDSFEIVLPEFGKVNARVRLRDVQLGNVISLSGSVTGHDMSHFVLTAHEQALSGSVRLGTSEWQLRSSAEGTTLQNEGAAGLTALNAHLPADYTAALAQQVSPAGLTFSTSESPAHSKTTRPASTREQAKAATAASIATVDLLFVSDVSYQQLMGGESNELADLANLVAVANTAFSDSNAYVRLRLAGYRRLEVDWTSLTQTQVYDQMAASSGAFATLWPEQVGTSADVLVAVSRFNNPKAGFCGLGRLGQYSSNGSYFNATPSSPIAMSRGSRGDGSYCVDSTLAHEVGHVLGAAHDRANASSQGAYNFSYGYGIAGTFGDIMSYLQPQVPYFSSPSLFTCANQACGTPTDDAVRTFNETAPWVAGAMDSNARLSGWYWDPAAPGTGWAVEVSNGRTFLAAFVYDDNGAPTWVAGTGAACAGRTGIWCVGLDEYAGGQTFTGPYRTARVARRVVDAELTFSGAYPATLEVRMGGVTRQLQRFLFSANGLSSKPTVPGTPIPGWYWNASAPGTGLFMERQNDTVFAAYFYYRADGSPTWAVVTGANYTTTFNANGGYSYSYNKLDFARYGSGQPLLGAYRAASVLNASEASSYLGADVGVMTLWNSAGVRDQERWAKFPF